MAASAGVSRLLLTHISPRYQDISTFVSQAREVFPETRVARDLDVYEIAFRQEE